MSKPTLKAKGKIFHKIATSFNRDNLKKSLEIYEGKYENYKIVNISNSCYALYIVKKENGK